MAAATAAAAAVAAADDDDGDRRAATGGVMLLLCNDERETNPEDGAGATRPGSGGLLLYGERLKRVLWGKPLVGNLAKRVNPVSDHVDHKTCFDIRLSVSTKRGTIPPRAVEDVKSAAQLRVRP